MRKILSLFAAFIMSALVAYAGEVTINMADQGYENAAELTVVTVNGVTLTFDANGNSTTPKYYESGTSARLYAKNQLTISAAQPLTKIVFSLSLNAGKMTIETMEVDGGEAVVDAEAQTLTWTGAAKEVTFTVPSEKLSTGADPQFRFSSVVVTLDGDVVIPEPVEEGVYILQYGDGQFEYGETGIWASIFDSLPTYQSGVFTLKHYGTKEGYETWNGFAPSIAQQDAGGYNYVSCVAKGGVKGEGTPYTLAYWPEFIASSQPNVILFGEGELKAVPQEVYFCNATQTYKDITEGDFNGYVMGKNDSVEDYVYVRVRGIVGVGEDGYTLTENAVDYYLADFREGKSFVNNGWEKCDLTSLGEVYGLVFDMASTGVGEYGINTSTYFALDQLKIKEVKEAPEQTVDFNYGEAVYMNNYLEAAGEPADKPTWELDLAYFTSNTDYTVYFAAMIETEKEDEVAGTYDLAGSEALIEFVDGTDTTSVDIAAGTLTLELVSKEDVSDKYYGDFTIYSYKVTLAATDADGAEYNYEGTIEEFYYSDMMDYVDDEPQELNVAEALEIIEQVGSTQTEEDYIVLGYVVKMKYPWDAEHKTATFWIDDTPAESEALQAYAVSPFEESDQNVKVGDFVAVMGPLVKYKNTPEINRGTYQILQIGAGLEIVDANELVRVMNGQLLVDATGKVEVYNISGQLLYNAQVAGQTTIRGLQQGQVLLVRVNDKIAKVVF